MAGRCGRAQARRSVRWSGACVLAVMLAVLAAGCGGSGQDATAGTSAANATPIEHVPRDRWTYARARFKEMCAGCHTLADAGATGRRFDLDREPGLNEELVRSTILGGGPGMPPFASSISYREFEELARYVNTVARRTGGADRWQWQIRLRKSGEVRRPPGWPPRSYLSVPRYNP